VEKSRHKNSQLQIKKILAKVICCLQQSKVCNDYIISLQIKIKHHKTT